MELSIFTRKKNETKRIKREGDIPAIFYSNGGKAEAIYIKKAEFEKIVRPLKLGMLPTIIFNLKKDTETLRAVIKDIQYDITSYQIVHIDFQEIKKDEMIAVKIPIECINSAECLGVKLGGTLRQMVYNLRVKCLPDKIPGPFKIDVKNLSLMESKKLSDIEIPPEIIPLDRMDEVVVVVARL